jgi:hypothetical protein
VTSSSMPTTVWSGAECFKPYTLPLMMGDIQSLQSGGHISKERVGVDGRLGNRRRILRSLLLPPPRGHGSRRGPLLPPPRLPPLPPFQPEPHAAAGQCSSAGRWLRRL